MKNDLGDATVITIASRTSTILRSDRVMVVKEGKIVEFDEPNALMEDRQSALSHLFREMESAE